MNKVRRKNLQAIIDQLEELKGSLEALQAEEEEYRDNIPENMQESERYEKAGDHAQITQRVLDFSTGEELHAAVDRVRDFFLQEKFLHAARNIVRAV